MWNSIWLVKHILEGDICVYIACKEFHEMLFLIFSSYQILWDLLLWAHQITATENFLLSLNICSTSLFCLKSLLTLFVPLNISSAMIIFFLVWFSSKIENLGLSAQTYIWEFLFIFLLHLLKSERQDLTPCVRDLSPFEDQELLENCAESLVLLLHLCYNREIISLLFAFLAWMYP